jgi:hypothetical protein
VVCTIAVAGVAAYASYQHRREYAWPVIPF